MNLRIEERYNRTRLSGFILNSLPKSGTHLLEKMTRLVPGIRYSGIFLAHESGESLGKAFPPEPVSIPVGVGWPVMVPRTALAHTLKQIEHGTFVLGHIPYSQEMVELLEEYKYKSLLILRDPRDVAVSMARYLPTVPANPLCPYFLPLSEQDRITRALMGIKLETGEIVLNNLATGLERIIPWCQEPINYTTYFERLVGPDGGGNRQAQIKEIEHILRHLGLWHSRSRIKHIADNLFGESRTFNKGQIGSWKQCFTPEHVRMAKELLGDWLVRLGYEKDMDW